jgi:beta-phosphoglucomutase family hydrolase
MTTRAFIFDMDGTMVESMPAHAKSWEEFRNRHDIDMSVDEILKKTTGRTGVECIRLLLGDELSEQRAKELAGEKEQIYRDIFAREFREVAGFASFLRQAQQRGLKVAVATAGDQKNLAFVLERLGLEKQPDAQVRGDQGLPGKPAPDIFLEAARQLDADPAECIVFEDAPFGIEAAGRARMRAVAICSTHQPAELAGEHVIAQVRDYEQLMDQKFLESLDA